MSAGAAAALAGRSPRWRCLALSAGRAAAEPAAVGDARLEPLAFADLAGWADDDHARRVRGLPPHLRGASPRSARRCAPALPAGRRPEAGLRARRSIRRAAGPAEPSSSALFAPFEVVPPAGRGFLTGYFEPEFEGSLHADREPSRRRSSPARTTSSTIPQGETLPGLEPGLAGGAPHARPATSPIRTAPRSRTGALGERARRSSILRDPVDAFIIHVQGSARIRLPGRPRRARRLCGPQRPSLHLDRPHHRRARRTCRSPR